MPTTISQGRKVVTTAGTAVQLSTSKSRIGSIAITAETDNTGYITIGNASVIGALATRQGTPLAAGDTLTFDIDQLSAIYLDTTVNGDGVTWTVTSGA